MNAGSSDKPEQLKAKYVCISPKKPTLYIEKSSEAAHYFVDAEFKDFSEFKVEDFSEIQVDPTRTFIFFDDHQAGPKRVRQAQELGFRHVAFDDNDPPGGGDNFSLKKLCPSDEKEEMNELLVQYERMHPYANDTIVSPHSGPFLYQDDFDMSREMISYEKLGSLKKLVDDKIIDVYSEFPPVWPFGSRKGGFQNGGSKSSFRP